MSNYQNYAQAKSASVGRPKPFTTGLSSGSGSRALRGVPIGKSSVTKVTKVNKMNKFKSWLRNWIMNDSSEVSKESMYITASDAPRDYDDDSSLRFTVTPARGGVILTVRNYDKRQDRHFYTAHVLHDDQNVAEGVAQIVSMELLRSSGT